MTEIPNPLSAYRAILSADAALETWVGERIFVGEIPAAYLSQRVPQPMIQVRPAGGPKVPDRDRLRSRVDVRCYAQDEYRAHTLAMEVWRIADQFTARDVTIPMSTGGTHICQVADIWAENQPTAQREQDDPQWPVAWASYLVFSSASPAA